MVDGILKAQLENDTKEYHVEITRIETLTVYDLDKDPKEVAYRDIEFTGHVRIKGGKK